MSLNLYILFGLEYKLEMLTRIFCRRLDRWEKGTQLGVMGTKRATPLKLQAINGNGTQLANDDTEDERPVGGAGKKDVNGDVNMEDEDPDDREKAGSGEEDEAGAEDLDEVDKELLGLGADETEDEASEGGMDVD